MKASLMKINKVLAVISIVLALSLVSVSVAQPQTGVKKGDWIEYKVTYTGSPPADHTITTARMEVLDVDSSLNMIYVNIVSTYTNGSQESGNYTMTLITGALIDDFIIPANLTTGDKFYDSRVGNITISNAKQDTYAGATRTVISASSGGNTYIWDQLTGVSVEGTSIQSDYNMHTLVSGTNMWQSSGLDPVIIYTFVAIIVIIVVAAAFLLLTKRKHKPSKPAEDFSNPPQS
jgi:hypothetical protein